jgi:hypothetical protein
MPGELRITGLDPNKASASSLKIEIISLAGAVQSDDISSIFDIYLYVSIGAPNVARGWNIR